MLKASRPRLNSFGRLSCEEADSLAQWEDIVEAFYDTLHEPTDGKGLSYSFLAECENE